MRRRHSPASLMVVRLLFVADGLIMGAVGLVALLFVDRPAGIVFAALAWGAAAALFGGVRFTDPYRGSRW